MSLYNDLNEVLTPYANKIKEVNESLDNLDLYVTERKNLIDYDKAVRGTIDANTGVVTENSGNNRISDYIPVEKDGVYYKSGFTWAYAYDSEKQFIERGSNLQPYNVDGCAFIRIDLGTSTTAEYIKSPNDLEDSDPFVKKIGDKLVKGISKSFDKFHETNGNEVVLTNNLFDYINDEYAFGTNFTTLVRGQETASKTNDYVMILKYIPVSQGDVVFCNYETAMGEFYDSNKEYVSQMVARAAYVGRIVPSGVSFARMIICATNANPTTPGRVKSLDDMKNVMIYKVVTNQTIAPKPPATLPMYQLDGCMLSNNYLDKVVPSMADSEFLSAMRCMTVREINKRDHAWRFGNFNMWVINGISGWYNTRKMLMDYGIDFCGFEECTHASGTGTVSLSKFLNGWQFPYGFIGNLTDGTDPVDKDFVSRFEVLSSEKLYFTTLSSNASYINCKVQLPRYMDIYNPKRILSVYVVHFAITGDANKIAIANELLAKIATDTSDFIVICGDTNDFGDTEESKKYWRTLEAGGFRPTIPIDTKTITQDIIGQESDEYPEKQWRNNSIDQFLVSDNIELVSYGVINTKDEYADPSCNKSRATDNEPALSDHDFVYADLRFKYDAPRSGLSE